LQNANRAISLARFAKRTLVHTNPRALPRHPRKNN
jgi:hypothetical protein